MSARSPFQHKLVYDLHSIRRIVPFFNLLHHCKLSTNIQSRQQ